MRILLIEDDAVTAKYIIHGLLKQGYEVVHESDGQQGLEKALKEDFRVLIVDRMLPGLSGMEIVRQLRENGKQEPILILSGMSDVQDRIDGLKGGSDDYLVKPFAIEELSARIEVLSRRNQETTFLKLGELEMDLLNQKVMRGETEINLQPREFKLLEYLVKNAGQVVTRTMLLKHVWEYDFDPQTNVIDVHMSRLRKKIDKGFEFALINTVRGAGYVINDSDSL